MNLLINDTEITKDAEGRYSLNDLHKSSGGLVKDLPNKFMASKSFKEIEAILNAENSAFRAVSKKQGRYNGGTWISKELVYKYAMWVSAEFELKVIRTFDKLLNINQSCQTMACLNELTAKIESDQAVASFCGKELNKYKKVKYENELKFNTAVNEVQMVLGFLNN